jgi:cytochrome c5
MNKSKQLKALVQIIFAAVVIGGLASTLYSAEPTSDSLSQTNSAPLQTNSVELKVSSPDTNNVVVKTHLTGAELYSINCNRCHAERFPTERTGAQWKTIMLHMQVRANIPVSQARLILQYLQENSGR